MSQTDRQHAHDLIDRMAPGQLSVIVDLLEVMIDPVQRALANAPLDDEPAEPIERTTGPLATHAEVLAEFGLTEEDFANMGRTPPPEEAVR